MNFNVLYITPDLKVYEIFSYDKTLIILLFQTQAITSSH